MPGKEKFINSSKDIGEINLNGEIYRADPFNLNGIDLSSGERFDRDPLRGGSFEPFVDRRFDDLYFRPTPTPESSALQRVIEEAERAERKRRLFPSRPILDTDVTILPDRNEDPAYREGAYSRVVAAGLKRDGVQLTRSASFNPLSGETGYEEFSLSEPEKIQQLFRDKGYREEAVALLAYNDVLGRLFTRLVLRTESDEITDGIENARLGKRGQSLSPYLFDRCVGTPDQNAAVDEGIAASRHKTDSLRKFSRRGATRTFSIENLEDIIKYEEFASSTPIIIVGGGPAGILTASALIHLGFDPLQINIIDKSGEYGGIWKQQNVAGGSKNNPFEISFNGTNVTAAPGPGVSISRFLDNIATDLDEEPVMIKGRVIKVVPGDLKHVVHYVEDGEEHTMEAPIVINAIGNGKPLPLSRETHMTTPVREGQAGIRWQQIITPEKAESYRGQTLVFIGLGNSTAEMMQQIEQYNKLGYGINYRVLTHYPREAIANPQATVIKDGREYRVFRDTKTPNLTKYEGDLPEAAEAYASAVEKGRIIPDVKSWDIKDGNLIATTDGITITIPHAQLFTLIGYRQEPETLKAMGMTVTDEYTGEIAYDYDGEIQKRVGAIGRKRVYPGYFGIGAVLKSRSNPNAEVIPGIQHRLYDLLFGVIMRSAEYHLKSGSDRAKRNSLPF